MNNSLSLTLDAFYTETSLLPFREEYTQDRFFSWMTNSRVRLQRRKSPAFWILYAQKPIVLFSRKSTAAEFQFQQLLVLLHLLVD